MPLLDRAATIAQIVLDHPACARVFRQHRIDFCCRGNVTVPEVCADKGLDASTLWSDLERAISDRQPVNADPRTLSTAELVTHIVSRHHDYLRKMLPFVDALAQKVARVHGKHEPKLVPLAALIVELRAMLEPHLDDEEKSLFPALVADATNAANLSQELGAMHEDHLRLGEALEQMRALSHDYAVPEWACTSYRTLMRELETLETDTFTHVHTENHVLMARFA